MTAVHIDTIHGDHFIREQEVGAFNLAQYVSPGSALQAVPGSQALKLSWHLGRPVYIVQAKLGQALVDARQGTRLPPPSQEEIARIAQSRYKGDERLVSLALIKEVPGEIRGRKPPLWRAQFSGWNKPTLYISPVTGELISRRHELWRVFDFMWMLHIMDYQERENVNNWLLRGMTVLALVTVLSGIWLLWFAFPRRRRKVARP